MTPKHSEFTEAVTLEAKRALEILSPREQVHFALNVILNVTDPAAHAAVNYAALEVGHHGTALTKMLVDEGKS